MVISAGLIEKTKPWEISEHLLTGIKKSCLRNKHAMCHVCGVLLSLYWDLVNMTPYFQLGYQKFATKIHLKLASA